MRIQVLGVRGSTPAPGAEHVRYGGHTACVAVSPGPGQAPVLALDAGTGLRTLGPLLSGAAFQGTILVTHLHWDHVQGIPFFAAGDRPDARVDVVVPAQGGRTGRDLLTQLMSPPAFPITPEGLHGRWRFEAVEAGPLVAEGFDVVAFDVAHKGGRTFGYRLERAGASVAYVPDHAPAAGVSDAALAAMGGVDLLVHDAQFLAPERARADDYGHATVEDAVDLAARVGARQLLLFHHGPHRDDVALDALGERLEGRADVLVARQGQVIDLPAAPPAR